MPKIPGSGEITPEALAQWLDGLCHHDRENFLTLIGLSTAAEVIGKMKTLNAKQTEYRNMAIFALALKTTLEKEGKAPEDA